MAALTASNPRVFKLADNVPLERVTKRILNGQSWKAGQWLYTDTSDLLKACPSPADSGTGGIKYIALTDQSDPGDSTTNATVLAIVQDTVFECNELANALALTDIGLQCEINVASNIITIDASSTTNAGVEIVDVGVNYNPAQYTIADTKARCLVKVLPTALEAAQA